PACSWSAPRFDCSNVYRELGGDYYDRPTASTPNQVSGRWWVVRTRRLVGRWSTPGSSPLAIPAAPCCGCGERMRGSARNDLVDEKSLAPATYSDHEAD